LGKSGVKPPHYKSADRIVCAIKTDRDKVETMDRKQFRILRVGRGCGTGGEER
jgi:hypothetical protein